MWLGSCTGLMRQVPLCVDSTPAIHLEGLLTLSKPKTTPTCPWRESMEKLRLVTSLYLGELSYVTGVVRENGSLLFHWVICL